MSIILKGIDMPSEKEGWQMDLRIHGFDDGTMMVEKLTRNGRPPFKMYRAIQIPKGHGRLIDADLLKDTTRDSVPTYTIGVKIPTFGDTQIMSAIDVMPTILEAEE